MSRRLLLFPLVAVVGLLGCHTCRRVNYIAARPHCCTGCFDGVQPPRAQPVPPAGVVVPPPGGSPPPAAELDRPVPTPAPDVLSPAKPMPLGDPPPAETPPPADPPATVPPVADPPATGTPLPEVRLGAPGPVRSESARVPTEPQTKEPPRASVPAELDLSRSEKREPASVPDPVDIPSYAIVVPGIAKGLKPFPDGINWLKSHGYKTVLHLRAPGENTSAARREFEKRGLNYLSLEASPARLSREVYEQFNQIMTDPKNRPLFVYDKDGSLVGGLSYLHFRVQLKSTPEKARSEAQRLGLRFDEDPEHQTIWLAVQKLLETLLP